MHLPCGRDLCTSSCLPKSYAGETFGNLTHAQTPFKLNPKSKSKLILKKKSKGGREVVLAQRNNRYLAIEPLLISHNQHLAVQHSESHQPDKLKPSNEFKDLVRLINK